VRLRARTGEGARHDAGFIMLDALTGVVIVSLMMAVCLATVKITRSQARAAADMKDAKALLSSLMETTPRTPGSYAGKSGGLSYAVEVTETSIGDSHLCEIAASVKSALHAHIYHLTGTRWCAGAPA